MNSHIRKWLGGFLIFGGVVSVSLYQIHQGSKQLLKPLAGQSKSTITPYFFSENPHSKEKVSDQSLIDQNNFSMRQPNGSNTQKVPNEKQLQKLKKSALDLERNSEMEIQETIKQTLEFNKSHIPSLIKLIQGASDELTILRATTALGSLVAEEPARSYLLQMILKAELGDVVLKAAANGLANKIEVFGEISDLFYDVFNRSILPVGAKTVVLESLTRYELMRYGLAFDRSPENIQNKKSELLKIPNQEIRESVFKSLGLD